MTQDGTAFALEETQQPIGMTMKSKNNHQQMTRTEFCKLSSPNVHPAKKAVAAIVWGVWSSLLLTLTAMATGFV